MPNWCFNCVTIYAEEETLEKIRSFVRSEKSDFEQKSVIAHEAGHAVQHAVGYKPIKLRMAIIPICNIGSMLVIQFLESIVFGMFLSCVNKFLISFELAILKTSFNSY